MPNLSALDDVFLGNEASKRENTGDSSRIKTSMIIAPMS